MRRGKAIDRPMTERLNEHKIIAKLKNKSDRDSTFYRSYPVCNIGTRVKYEWIDVCMALCCYPKLNGCYESLLTSNTFCFDKANSTISRSSNLLHTKYECISYLFECCYDLMMSAASNVSESPGFEKFNGQH